MDMSMVTTAAPSPTQSGMIPNCRRWMKSNPKGDTCWEFASRAQDSLPFFLSLNPFLGANGENCPTLFWPNYYYCINSGPSAAAAAPTTLVSITPTPASTAVSTPTMASVKEPEKAATGASAAATGSVTNGIYSGPGITYVGCPSSQTFSSSLTGAATIDTKMTIERCLAYCSNARYPVAGIASGTQCFCAGATTSSDAGSTANTCTTKCGGDDKQMCGGDGGHWSVYKNDTVKAAVNLARVNGGGTNEFAYLGCFDETAQRALDYNRGLGLTMTVDKCVGYCDAMGKSYASVRSGTQCYCGTAVNQKAPMLKEDICGVQCGGNTSEICGGANFASVYKKGATTTKTKKGRTLGPAGVTVGEDGRPTVVKTLKMVRHDRFGQRNVFPA